jgi:hypothetical protein
MSRRTASGNNIEFVSFWEGHGGGHLIRENSYQFASPRNRDHREVAAPRRPQLLSFMQRLRRKGVSISRRELFRSPPSILVRNGAHVTGPCFAPTWAFAGKLNIRWNCCSNRECLSCARPSPGTCEPAVKPNQNILGFAGVHGCRGASAAVVTDQPAGCVLAERAKLARRSKRTLPLLLCERETETGEYNATLRLQYVCSLVVTICICSWCGSFLRTHSQRIQRGVLLSLASRIAYRTRVLHLCSRER